MRTLFSLATLLIACRVWHIEQANVDLNRCKYFAERAYERELRGEILSNEGATEHEQVIKVTDDHRDIFRLYHIQNLDRCAANYERDLAWLPERNSK